jgi:prephenate dehydratase
MTVTLAYLGPDGTFSQLAALVYSLEIEQQLGSPVALQGFPTIPRTIGATARGITSLSIVPVENSIEGGVTPTLDTLWQFNQLQIQRAMVMAIRHGLLSYATNLAAVQVVYSHPQALSQCQLWLEKWLPWATLVPTRSTAEPLQHLSDNPTVAAIASEWAAGLYNLPVLAHQINDHSENCTKFWVLGPAQTASPTNFGTYTSLAFSLPVNAPGALLKPLQVFADHAINLSRIESRPAKRALGEYVFFVDLEAGGHEPRGQDAMLALQGCTERLINFGSYDLITAAENLAAAKLKYRQLQEPHSL